MTRDYIESASVSHYHVIATIEIRKRSLELIDAYSQYSSKASALAAMQPSSAAVGVALRGRKASLDPKTTELIATFLEHRSEHYSQSMTLQESVSGNLIFTGTRIWKHCLRRVHPGARQTLEVVLAHRLHFGRRRPYATQFRPHAEASRGVAGASDEALRLSACNRQTDQPSGKLWILHCTWFELDSIGDSCMLRMYQWFSNLRQSIMPRPVM